MPMDVADEIAREIHGIELGLTATDVICDCHYTAPRPIDTDERVQYECVRLGEPIRSITGIDVPDIWGPDLLRCPDGALDSLSNPTTGIGEAIVEVDIDQQDHSHVIDASALMMLDHSPKAEGKPLPAVPLFIVKTAIEQPDLGSRRRSRLERIV